MSAARTAPASRGRGRGPARAAILALVLSVPLAPRAGLAQEIQESDLYFSDPANLSHVVDQAVATWKQGQGDAARAQASTVIETARLSGDPRLRPLLVRALLLRAEIALAGRDRPAAVSDLAEALAVDPGAAAKRGDRSAVAVLLGEQRARLVGALSVTSDPPGAAVTIGGRALGQTPLSDISVLLGNQMVRIERPGFATVEREVAVKKGVRVSVAETLARTAATFLLITDADGATLTLDGAPLGQVHRPDGGEAQRLIASFNVPIDPDRPPPLFLWRDAAPGPHRLAMAAPCRKPLTRIIDIPASTDSTTVVPMEPASGRLRLEGPRDARVRLDGVDCGAPPLSIEDLCPGLHTLEAEAPPARRTAATIEVRDGEETVFRLRFVPVIAWLGGDESVRRRLSSLERFNLLAAPTGSGAAPGQVVGPGGEVRPAGRDLVLAATAADLLAWSEARQGRGELWLLAASSREADRLPLGSARERNASIAALDAALPLFSGDLGLVVSQVPLLEHLLVAALAEAGPAARAGLRIGDEVVAVGGEEVTSLVQFDLLVTRLLPGQEVEVVVRRAGSVIRAALSARRAALDLDFLSGQLPRNAALARIEHDLVSGDLPGNDLPYFHFARGKAEVALGDWERAYASFALADPPPSDGVGPGTILYYRGLAAERSGRPDQAREAWQQALRFPGARLIGPDGPLVLPLVREQLEALGEASE